MPERASDIPEPWDADRINQSWCPVADEVVQPVFAMRGDQPRDLRCGSLFDGLSSDKKVAKLWDVRATWAFSCDKFHLTIRISHGRNFISKKV